MKIYKKSVIAGTVLLLVALFTESWILVKQLNAAMEKSKWVSHTYQVISKIETVLIDMVNIETGSRGYYLTGNQEFLEPYNNGISIIDTHIHELNNLIADNPKQLNNVRRLTQLVAEKRNISEYVVLLTHKQGASRASANLNIDKQKMDVIRQKINEMTNLEKALLITRETEENNIVKMHSLVEVLLIITTAIATIGFAI